MFIYCNLSIIQEMIPRYCTGGSTRRGSSRPGDTITQAENPFIKHNRSSVEINGNYHFISS